MTSGPAPLVQSVAPLDESSADAAIGTLADAFRDYPVMRFVLGPDGEYAARLQRLIGLFVRARFARGGPVVGVRDGSGLIGVATMTRPEEPHAPATFADWRERLWAELGHDARHRYDQFIAAAETFEPTMPHHHLNMIGVRRSHQGRGVSRALLAAVHELAGNDAGSAGVSLTTEHAPNVTLYEHFGYRVLGHARVSDVLETWVMFRPRG